MPSPSRRNLLAVSAALIGAAMLPARAAAPVKVSSKLDTEGALLGNMILALLKPGSVPTENRLRLGSTKIMRSALLAGEIDLYPGIHRQWRLLLQPGQATRSGRTPQAGL